MAEGMGYSSTSCLITLSAYCLGVFAEAVLSPKTIFKYGNKTLPFLAFIRMNSKQTTLRSASSKSQRQRLDLVRALFDAVLSNLGTWRNAAAQD